MQLQLLQKSLEPNSFYVDMDDEGKGSMACSRKDSFFWCKKVLTSNGEDLA